ncbi:MAG: hypothetical protein LBJ08_04105, partial [Bifidobacteriaceae bacterium]|nr:hypothetical protein [Bifidobacteriaceae bacterium]
MISGASALLAVGTWAVMGTLGTDSESNTLGAYLIYTESLATNAPYALDTATVEAFRELGAKGKRVQLIRITHEGRVESGSEGLIDLTP